MAPPVPQKKSGCGCFGCGCAILAAIILLIVGVVGAGGYFAYSVLQKASSPTPLDLPAVAEDPAAYNAVLKKVNEFQLNMQNHQPATLSLNSDEVNALVANNPDYKKSNIKSYVTFKGSSGQIQCSIPCDLFAHGFLAGRYLNGDTTFTVQFDSAAKDLEITPSTFILGGTDYLASGDKASLDKAIARFNASLNEKLHADPKTNATLNQLTNVTIKDGQLVIESK